MNQVEFLGQVGEQLKRDLFVSASLYLAPALYGESFGIVLLEAMQAGIPLAGYANDGYMELLTDEQLNYFVDPGDIQGLFNTISRIQKNSNIEELKALGRKHASSYNWDMLIKKIEKVYT